MGAIVGVGVGRWESSFSAPSKGVAGFRKHTSESFQKSIGGGGFQDIPNVLQLPSHLVPEHSQEVTTITLIPNPPPPGPPAFCPHGFAYSIPVSRTLQGPLRLVSFPKRHTFKVHWDWSCQDLIL